MKRTKREMNLYSFFDFPSIEKHLEEMAARGWMLAKADDNLWKYERREPMALHFAITYFPKATNIDPEPSEEQRTLWEYCERTGWKLAAQAAQMQIFYNEQADPVPLETDPVARVNNIHRAAKRILPIGQGIMFLIGLINFALFLYRLSSDRVDMLSSPSDMAAAFCWLVVMLLSIVEAAAYFAWYRRARLAAAAGWLALPKGTRGLQICSLAAVGLVLVFWLGSYSRIPVSSVLFGFGYVAAIMLLVRGLMLLLKRKKVKAGVNLTISVIVSFGLSMLLIFGMTRLIIRGNGMGWLTGQGAAGTYMYYGREVPYYADTLPLSLQDLGIEARQQDYSSRFEGEGTVFLYSAEGYQRARYDVEGDMPEMEYRLLNVKAPFLYDTVKEALLTEGGDLERDWIPEREKDIYRPDEPAVWGAKEAYRLASQAYGPRHSYLICYEGSMAEVSFHGFEPTGAQLLTAGERIRAALAGVE